MKIETGKTNQAHSIDLMYPVTNANGRITDNKPLIPDVPSHIGPVHRPPPNAIRHIMSNQQISQSSPSMENNNPNINFDFQENSLFQEGVMSETFHRPNKSFLRT